MQSIINLFQGESATSAIIVAAVAFGAGFVVAMILAKLTCTCRRRANGEKCAGKKCAKADAKFQKRHPAPADGSIEIYVGNLSYDLTEERLRKEFEAYGVVNSARIITNRYTRKSKGFGFVHMPNRAEADAAVKALSDKDILGRKLKCNEAKNVIV